MLTLKTHAHAIREEEADLSFAEFHTAESPERPYAAPASDDDSIDENAPYLGEAARQAIRNPGIVSLARGFK